MIEGQLDDAIAFLGSVMIDSQIMLETKIKPEMLGEHSVYCRLFKILDAQVNAKLKPNFKTVWNALKEQNAGAMPFQIEDAQRVLQEINTVVPSAANWRFHEGRIIDIWARNKIRETCVMISEMTGPSFKSSDYIEQLERTIAEVTMIETGYEIKTIRQLVPEIVDKIQQRYNLKGALLGVSTGLTDLDMHTYGMQPGCLWVVGARPSQGKSAIMGQIHRNVALRAKVPCGVITVESSNYELGLRSFSAESKIPSSKINTGKLSSGDFTTIQDTASEFYELDDRILYYDRPGIDIRDVKSTARRMVKKNKAKVIFLDYLQLIRVDGMKDKYLEVGRVVSELKAIARDLNITIVALAQLKRDADGNRPQLGDFQHSSQIEQDADVALMLYHENNEREIKQPDGRMLKTDVIDSYIIVGKARDGLTGDIPVIFDKPILTFKEKEKNEERYT
jgi:replicative DNA helicase